MIKRFLDYIAIEKRYSPRTVKEYGDDLRAWCGYLGWTVENFDPKPLDADDVKGWMMQMLESGQSARSVKRRLSAVKSLYRFLLGLGLVRVNITSTVILPKVNKPLPIFFRESEMEAFKEQNKVPSYDEGMDKGDWLLAMRDYLLVEMLYQTGMRRAELAALEDKDVDVRGRQIRVFGKRRKERMVPMGDQLAKLIEEYLRVKREILLEYEAFGTFLVRKKRNGEWVALGAAGIYNIVRARMGDVSTLKKHSPHVLRHTFATTMLNNGADVRTIQTLLGHSSLEATQVYTHTTFEQVKQIYEVAHPRSKK
ncbi:MAG: tyrosine-type recombinase/integrase [Paludibacteraceae bacterium]|nr:tyrosine-type recombinase/integrase [Paludibacteraceae bacterium]